jgi:tetratricopeptide (TPR) repeat protein
MSDVPTTNSANRPRRRRARLIGLFLILIAVLAAYYLFIIYLGWQSGQQLLSQRQEQQVTTQLARQVELAQADIAAEKYALAQRRLEWVLARDPHDGLAQQLYNEVQSHLNVVLTPQPVQLTPTASPLPSPTPGLIENPASELVRIEQLVDGAEWAAAVSALQSFQQQFPDHERDKTDRLLYNAYVELGLKYVEGSQVELGLFYLSLAERLGDLPEMVTDYRVWGELYVQGISFYGVNWGAAAFYFRDLCLAAPFYQNACQRLEQILINHGDQYAFVEDWCPAEQLYQEAQLYNNSPQLAQKLTQAGEGCLLATPTPAAPITDTAPITNTAPYEVNPFPRFILPTPEPGVLP